MIFNTLGSPFPIRVGTKKKKSTIIKTSVKDILSKPSLPESPPPVNHIKPVSPLVDNSSPLYSPQYVKQTQNMTKNLKNSFDETDYRTVKTIHINRDEEPFKSSLSNGFASQKNVIQNERIEKTTARNLMSSENFKNELITHVKRSANESPSVKVTSPIFRGTSPILKSKSPSFRIESPVHKSSSPVSRYERVQSPIDRSISPVGPSYRMTTTTSTYKSTERNVSPMLRHSSPTQWNGRRNSIEFNDENIDKSSNVRGTRRDLEKIRIRTFKDNR